MGLVLFDIRSSRWTGLDGTSAGIRADRAEPSGFLSGFISPRQRTRIWIGAMNAAQGLIQIRGLSKSYDGVHALSDVNLDLAPAEIHAVCGENGAGKSTLIKMLSGIIHSDAGQISVNGTQLITGSVQASEAAGIAVMHQESAAFPDLNAVENLFVGREITRCRGMFLNHAAMKSQTQGLLQKLGVSVDMGIPVGELPLAQRHQIHIHVES